MKKKIFVKAPVLSQSGYGEQSRFALRALRSREDLFDITGGRTVPQIVVDGKTIGGFDDLQILENNGQLT